MSEVNRSMIIFSLFFLIFMGLIILDEHINPNYDLNGDNKIDMVDMSILSSQIEQ